MELEVQELTGAACGGRPRGAHRGAQEAYVHVAILASWQRCRVHFMRNALAHAGKSGRRVVSAFIATPLRRTMPTPRGSSSAAACARHSA
jgi:Transposase, Mutator family